MNDSTAHLLRPTIHMTRNSNGEWISTEPSCEFGKAILHPDEPHFQKKIVEYGLPLIYQGHIFIPLCSEFPGSPGVDIIYLCKDMGYIILAELKKVRKNVGEDAEQCKSNLCKYREKTIANF